jgi:hypothetical protein
MPPLANQATAAAPQQDGGLGSVIKGAVNSALQEARVEMQASMNKFAAQRAQLQAQLDITSSAGERARLQARIDRLDRQMNELSDGMAKLGNGIDRTSPRINLPTIPVIPAIPEVGTAPRFPSSPPMRVDPTEIVAVTLGILFVAFPLTLAISRFLWKRATSAPSSMLSPEQTRRFDRLEQSVDAIAIEIERISENQRYLTKVLGESRPSAKIGS